MLSVAQTEEKRGPISALISSREKVSVMARKITLYLYFHNKNIFDLKQLISTIGGETKKILEIVFVLEGVGFIYRISRCKFVFLGFEGMIQKFQSNLYDNYQPM